MPSLLVCQSTRDRLCSALTADSFALTRAVLNVRTRTAVEANMVGKWMVDLLEEVEDSLLSEVLLPSVVSNKQLQLTATATTTSTSIAQNNSSCDDDDVGSMGVRGCNDDEEGASERDCGVSCPCDATAAVCLCEQLGCGSEGSAYAAAGLEPALNYVLDKRAGRLEKLHYNRSMIAVEGLIGFLQSYASALPQRAVRTLQTHYGRGLRGGNNIAGEDAQRVMNEIHETEASFVQGLVMLKEAFMTPIQDRPRRVGLTAKDVEVLFPSDIDLFLQLHTTRVLPLLESVVNTYDVDECAAAFLQIVPLVAFYQHYFDAYPEAMDILREKLKTTKKLVEFIDETEARLKAQKQPGQSSVYLTHLLANPFQRPMRYNLLLRELCKRHCGKENIGDEAHLQACAICQSSKKMEQMTTALNEKRRVNENKKECVNIINMFEPKSEARTLLSANLHQRQYVHEGEVTAVEGGEIKELYMFVFSDSLVVSTRPSVGTKKRMGMSLFRTGRTEQTWLKLEQFMDMSILQVVESDENQTDFFVRSVGTELVFRVKKEDRGHWVSMIETQHQRAFELNLRQANAPLEAVVGGADDDVTAMAAGGAGPSQPIKSVAERRMEKTNAPATMVPRMVRLSFFRDPLFEDIVEGLETGANVTTDQEQVLGRQGDIKIMDRTVSRRQCVIAHDPARASFTIRDLGSVGGTFMNAKRVLAFPGHTLEDGDVFFAGKCKFQVRRDFDNPDLMHLDFRSGLATGPEGDDEFIVYDLDLTRDTIVGRAPQIDPVANNVIKIVVGPDSGLSRTHFRITPSEDGVYQLHDERSRFGTFANPKPVGTEVGFPLGTGDVIQICEAVWVRVQIEYGAADTNSSHGSQLASQKLDYASMLNEWMVGQSTVQGGGLGGGGNPLMTSAFRSKIESYKQKARRREELLREAQALEAELTTMHRTLNTDFTKLSANLSDKDSRELAKLIPPPPASGPSASPDALETTAVPYGAAGARQTTQQPVTRRVGNTGMGGPSALANFQTVRPGQLPPNDNAATAYNRPKPGGGPAMPAKSPPARGPPRPIPPPASVENDDLKTMVGGFQQPAGMAAAQRQQAGASASRAHKAPPPPPVDDDEDRTQMTGQVSGNAGRAAPVGGVGVFPPGGVRRPPPKPPANKPGAGGKPAKPSKPPPRPNGVPPSLPPRN